MSRLSKLVRNAMNASKVTSLDTLSVSIHSALQNQMDMTSKLDTILSHLKEKEDKSPQEPEQSKAGTEVPKTPYSISKTEHGHMVTNNQDMIIGESIRLTGSFEEKHIEDTVQFLKNQNIKINKSIFVDIGANIGTHTIFALKNGFQKALCVEPDPENFKLLRINQIMNDLDVCCINICAAASETAGAGRLETSPDNFGDNRVLSQQALQKNVHAEQNWIVKDIIKDKIDTIVINNGINFRDIGLVWVDTQGHEGYVFGGGNALLASPAPIVCEFWPYGLNRSGGYEMLRAALKASGRQVYDLRESLKQNALAPLNNEQMDAMFHQFLAQETPEASPHTDLLLLPANQTH